MDEPDLAKSSSLHAETIRLKGSIHYAIPHIKKKLLWREGRLPIRLKCEPSYILAAEEFLNL